MSESGANAVTALAERLRDLHPPEPIGWWPPAPGWWLVTALTLVGGAVLLVRITRRRAARRAASLSSELQACHEVWRTSGDTARYYAHSAVALRRAAIARTGRAGVARLSGEHWVDWLDDAAGVPFTDKVREVLADGLYRPAPPERVAAVHRELMRWAEAHERPSPTERRPRA